MTIAFSINNFVVTFLSSSFPKYVSISLKGDLRADDDLWCKRKFQVMWEFNETKKCIPGIPKAFSSMDNFESPPIEHYFG